MTTKANHPKKGGSGGDVRWLVMIYLAGDNNLSEEMVWALECMMEQSRQALNAGRQLPYELFAQFDPLGDFIPPQFFDFSKMASAGPGLNPSSGPEPYVERWPRHLMDFSEQVGDVEEEEARLRKKKAKEDQPDDENGVEADIRIFVEKCIERAQGRLKGKEVRTMLILSGHGDGITGGFLPSWQTDVSLQPSRLKMLTGNIAEALPNQKIDILGLDSCLMAMIEVCYEVRKVGILIGSQGYEPMTGWPYHKILDVLRLESDIDPESFAKQIVRRYIGYYTNYLLAGISVDLAACDLSETHLEDVRSKVGILAAELTKRIKNEDRLVLEALLLAHWKAQSFKQEQYVDLYDFCGCLSEYLKRLGVESEAVDSGHEGRGLKPSLAEICQSVQRSVVSGDKKLVLRARQCGPDYQHAHGLAVFFPWTRVAGLLDQYAERGFAQKSGWADFLKVYLEKSRLKPRVRPLTPAEMTPEKKRRVPGKIPDQLRDRKLVPILATPDVSLLSYSPAGVRTGTLASIRGSHLWTGCMRNPPQCYYCNEFEQPWPKSEPSLLSATAPVEQGAPKRREEERPPLQPRRIMHRSLEEK